MSALKQTVRESGKSIVFMREKPVAPCTRKSAGRPHNSLQAFHLRRQGILDPIDGNSELSAQRMSGYVIGTLEGASRVLAQFRILLNLEHGLGKGAVGLLHQDHKITGFKTSRPFTTKRWRGALRCLSLKTLLYLVNLNQPELESLEQIVEAVTILLPGRDHKGVGIASPDAVEADLVKVPQPARAVARGMQKAGFKRYLLVFHDVPQAPFAAGPGLRKVPARSGSVIVPPLKKLLRGNGHRSRQTSRGGLRQETNSSMVVLVSASGRIGVIDGVGDDPFSSRGNQRGK